MIKRIDAFGDDGVVAFEDQVKEQLVAIQKDGPATDFTAKNRNIVLTAKFQINLLL